MCLEVNDRERERKYMVKVWRGKGMRAVGPGCQIANAHAHSVAGVNTSHPNLISLLHISIFYFININKQILFKKKNTILLQYSPQTQMKTQTWACEWPIYPSSLLIDRPPTPPLSFSFFSFPFFSSHKPKFFFVFGYVYVLWGLNNYANLFLALITINSTM